MSVPDEVDYGADNFGILAHQILTCRIISEVLKLLVFFLVVSIGHANYTFCFQLISKGIVEKKTKDLDHYS